MMGVDSSVGEKKEVTDNRGLDGSSEIWRALSGKDSDARQLFAWRD